MNERDVKLLFDAGHWSGATIKFARQDSGWLVELRVAETDESHILMLKRGKPRIFKTSDTALSWCRDVGFEKITVQLQKLSDDAIGLDNINNTVLLVEDNNSDIELTMRAIQAIDANFNVIVCKDGEDALDFLFASGKHSTRKNAELPKLILLDLKLPKIGGLEVLKSIRENKETSSIPVVILSTSDEDRDISRGYELGTNSYVQKPVDYNLFCKTIKELGDYWLVTNKMPPT